MTGRARAGGVDGPRGRPARAAGPEASSDVDLMLVSPPVGNVGQAAASISVLTAFLRSRGWRVDQWDASIDAFHHFHSEDHLRACERALAEAGAAAGLVEAAGRAAAFVERAKRLLRDPGTATDTAAMEEAFSVLDDAGAALTGVGRGRFEHSYRRFSVAGAWADWASLRAALGDREANPYLAWTEEQAVPRILRSGARAVGIGIGYLSQLLPGFTLARSLARRAPGLPVAVGGAYLTALGEEARRIPREVLPADAVLLYDGEAALDAWLGRVLGATGAAPSEGGCTDLAAVPSPCWVGDGLELSRYLVPGYAIPLPLTRGCHWGRCHYCNISAQTASSYRVRPVDLALEDLRQAIAETGSHWFDFPVDSFRPDHLRQLALGIVAEGLQVRWAAEVLMDRRLTREVLSDLARSGCVCLRFGMESACPETLAAMGKPRPKELAARILRDCREAGIRTGVMLIVGFPTETVRQRQLTFEFLVDHREAIDFVALHQFGLVPGSPMAQDPGAHGLILLPRVGVLQPSLGYRNANQVGLDQGQVAVAAEAMHQALGEYYPDLGKPWAVAIGGWMTFARCCLLASGA